MKSSNGSRRLDSAARELRFEKAIGRVGALAVVLGVGVGLGTPLGCGIAGATGPDSTSSSSDQSGGPASAGNASGGASNGTGMRSPARARRDSAATSSVTSSQGRTPAPANTVNAGRGTGNGGAEPRRSVQPGSAGARGPAQPGIAAANDVSTVGTAGNDSAPAATAYQQTRRARRQQALPETTNGSLETVVDAGVGSLPAVASTAATVSSLTGPVQDQPALMAAASPAPITLKTIVTDTLTWIGLGRLAPLLPIPDLPVPAFIESLWLGVREVQRTLNNQRPTAQPTLSGQDPDGTIRGSLNATDFEDDPLTYSVGPAGKGEVTVEADGNFTYVPGTQIAATGGTDNFTFTIDDTVGTGVSHGLLGLLGPTTATVTVTVAKVQPVNQAPTAVNDSGFATAEDIAITLSAAQLVGNDTDPNPGDTLSVASVAGASNGTVALNPDGSVKFTPTANYTGPGAFTYTVKDVAGLVSANSATVGITVTPVNDAPHGVNDGPFSVTQNTPLTLTAAQLVGNDTDPDTPYADTLSVGSVGGASGGTAKLNTDGTVTFTPTTDYTGAASFTYRVNDTAGATSATDATVTLTVIAVNQAPTAVNDSGFATAEDTVLTLSAAQLVGNDTTPTPGTNSRWPRWPGPVTVRSPSTATARSSSPPPPTTPAAHRSPTPSKTPPAR